MKKIRTILPILFLLLLPIRSLADTVTGEGPNLGNDRITQDQIEIKGVLPLREILEFGLRIFTTPFNRSDGYGDGPYDPMEDPRLLGERPTLQGNGTFLRVNGLDAQTCLECHFITRNSTIPASFGIGGVAGGSASAIFMPSFIDVAETDPGAINGRFINPPFLFGSGGVELLAKEMTIRLQKLKARALANPGTPVKLTAKGVNFGTIIADTSGNLDTPELEGIDEDLVVRPFGRKGEFATVRAFDVGAMQFHFGMQPVEVVGEDEDGDGDEVSNEILVGELSALHIFLTTRPRPVMEKLSKEALLGFTIFKQVGCANCHKPSLNTRSKMLTYSFPEVETDPKANIFYEINLRHTANFRPNLMGGIVVPLFADLKRHDMGPDLAESFDLADDKSNREFTTARLWGVRDTAPYLHDGRALTIKEAILMHGGEAEAARENFAALNRRRMKAVLSFLYSLRTPTEAGLEEDLGFRRKFKRQSALNSEKFRQGH